MIGVKFGCDRSRVVAMATKFCLSDAHNFFVTVTYMYGV